MALKAIANKDEFESLPGDVQSHYSHDEKSDVYRLSVTPVDGIELSDSGGLKSALQKERNATASLKTALSAFDGLKADEARAALEELESLKKDGGNKTREEIRAELDAAYTEKFNRDKESLTAKFSAELDAKDKRLSNVSSQLERQLVDSAAMSAINAARGSTELLVPIVRNFVKPVELDNGNLALRVFDTNGHERMSPKAGSSDPMTVEEFIDELRADKAYGRAFDASGHSGSGATGSDSTGIDSGNAIVLTSEAARDPVKYRAAKEKAQKQGKTLMFQE